VRLSLLKRFEKKSPKKDSPSVPEFDFENRDKFDDSIVGKATRAASDEIVSKIDVNAGDLVRQAKVIKADAEVYINTGAAAGFVPGQRLLVFRPGEELIDPDSGLSLGSEESQIGIIEIVHITVGNGRASVCKMVSGSGFQPNDIVRLK